MATRSWQVPDASTDERYKLGWVDEICEDGENWNKSQPGFNDWEKSLHILNGTTPANDVSDEFRDYMCGRRLRTNVRTAISGLANIRPIWGYHAAKEYAQYAQAWNKTTRALYLQNHWGRDIKDLVSYAAATNTGWIRPTYRRGMGGTGEGTIQLFTYGQPCVLPFQMPASGNYQEAYAVTLMDEWPVWEAHSRFPLYQDQLQATKSMFWYSQEIRGAAHKNAGKREWFNPFSWRGQKQRKGADFYIPFRFTTVIDLSVNLTGKTIPMGQPGTPWYYEVPAYGTEILSHYDADGKPVGKSATEDDARMYPFRRLMISSEKCMPYDGPAFNWHGQLDLIPLAVDKWPWAPGGFGMIHDAWGIEKHLNAVDSGIMTRIRAQNNMPLVYDINAMTKTEAEAYDPMDTANVRIGVDKSELEGTPFQLGVPFEVYKIYEEQLKYRQALIESMDYTMQMRDLVELSKAKVLGKDMEAMEKLLSSLGPIVRDIGADMEESLAMVGHQVGYLIPQYMTAATIMQYTGAEGMPPEIYDYNPNDLYPSHLPDEVVHDDSHKQKLSRYTSAQRARWTAKKIRFVNTPNSIHQIHQTSTLLNLLQMKQRGIMISDYSIENAANVPNIEPPDGNTEQEMWMSEMEDKIAIQTRLAIITKQVTQEQELGPPPGAAPPGGKGKGGRPPTAQTAPHKETKGDGRQVISESK